MFRTHTSRCAPTSKWIFGVSKWGRNIIKPSYGCAVVYLDYRAAEIFVAAKLSGDNNPIHISKETGNKSQFGENIVHGSLALIKILKKIKIKNFASINTDFLSIIKYNLNCEIKLLILVIQ